MFSCTKEHLTPKKNFASLLSLSESSCGRLWTQASLSSLFLSSLYLSSILPKISSEHLLCARLWVSCTRLCCGGGGGVFFFFFSHASCGPDMLGSVSLCSENASTQMLHIWNSWYCRLSLSLRLYSEKELTKQYFRSCVRSWNCAKFGGRGCPDIQIPVQQAVWPVVLLPEFWSSLSVEWRVWIGDY